MNKEKEKEKVQISGAWQWRKVLPPTRHRSPSFLITSYQHGSNKKKEKIESAQLVFYFSVAALDYIKIIYLFIYL